MARKKWGRIGSPKSAKRRAWLKKIRPNPRRKTTRRKRR